MRLAGAGPCSSADSIERLAELVTQLRSAGYSSGAAGEMALRVLAGQEQMPRTSMRFARVYGDPRDVF